ncbi:lipocalin family protein [Loigolactobacillus binensis]|uniref:Lipocalin family protein n=1 Tax=Loigolactobacillus binensis TaxID=2559922 RepID=A0ABW3ECJ7_9LACO|nr:lipocalin family protein [Loigolactobacillus binensis]
MSELKLDTELNRQANVDVMNDLPLKPNFIVNSWFAVGHFETAGHQLSYLVHVMSQLMPSSSEPMITSCVSVTDQTTQKYYTDSHLYPLSKTDIHQNEFHIKTTNTEITGDLNHMHLISSMPDATVDVDLIPVGYPIYNGGTGKFPLVGMDVFQYSIPTIRTNGTITIEDTDYPVSGRSWFDRQWQLDITTMPKLDPTATKKAPKFNLPQWGWMDLNLADKTVASLWFANEGAQEKTFATVLHPNGTQQVVAVEPIMSNATAVWTSPDSDYRYPTQWLVDIPELDLHLTVTCAPKEQELLFSLKELSHYEAASTISGTYKGEPITGNCYVELIGEWQ